MRRLAITAVLLGLSALSTYSHALSSVYVETRGGGTAFNDTMQGDVEASNQLMFGGSSAAGYANLETGVLKASAVGATGSADFGFVSSRFFDTIAFVQGATGTGYIDWRIDGSITPRGDGHDSVGYLDFNANGQNEGHAFTNYTCDVIFVTTCSAGAGFDRSGSFAFQIQPGSTSLQITLQVSAYEGATADFSNTARFFLRVPDGVTYTSESGVLFALAAPIAAVPEPESYALLLTGFALVSVVALRRKPVQMDPRST